MISYDVNLLETDPDRERFIQIYRANYQRMSRLAAQMLGSGPRAEDAVHDTFLKFIQNYYKLQEWSNDRLGAWLIVVLKNTALDMLRKEQREVEMEDAGCGVDEDNTLSESRQVEVIDSTKNRQILRDYFAAYYREAGCSSIYADLTHDGLEELLALAEEAQPLEEIFMQGAKPILVYEPGNSLGEAFAYLDELFTSY